MSTLRTVFAGTPQFALPSLAALHEHRAIELVAVYTQPDRPAGRGRRLTASPVKRFALEAGLSVEQPRSLSAPTDQARFIGYDAALLVVAAYGLILPRAVIEVPTHAINVHASLLPRWRGAAPIQRAIIAGDRKSGVSIMRIVEALDAGPVWLTLECPIEADETGGSLHDKLAQLGAQALREAIDRLVNGSVEEKPQDDSQATYAEKIGPADRRIDWRLPALEIERRVRALSPAPAALATLGGIEMKIHACRVLDRAHAALPGTVLAHGPSGIDIAAGAGALRILELQPPGKQCMSAAAYLRGRGATL